MRDINSIVQAVLEQTKTKMSVKDLIKAHEAAAEWHQALADALEYEALMAEFEPGDFDHELAKEKYPQALGRAAVAFQKVPVKWMAVLNADIRPVDNVVPLRPAAE